MLSSALSMSATAGHTHRDKSHQNINNLRSKSQPGEHRYNYFPPSSPPMTHPMKAFIEDLLHLTPHRHVSPYNTNRSKVSSSLSTAIPSDRSSRIRFLHASVISSISMHSTNAHSPYETRPLPSKLTLKFRRAGNLTLFAIYWCNLARKKNQSRSIMYQSYLHTVNPAGKYLFDKSNFKVQSFEVLPIVQNFFKQPTGERDIINTNEIRQCLTDIKPFTRLPKELQDQLLQQAWYECYPHQRTIVRQGERPSCFYIILSGSAIPTYKRTVDGSIETLDVLKRGCTFGEKGIMTDSTQNFTVMSNTEIELLVLWKDDFKSIFMTNERYCSKDDLRFLKTQVPFLRGFPIDRLHEIPNAIQHCHFGASEVIARDSRRMKHLFIVKKGSLAIWKRLDPNANNRDLTKTNFEYILNGDEETGDNRRLFSEIQLSGDINESQSNTNALEADFRLSRLRRSPNDNPRIASGLSSTTRTVANDTKKFPGLIDKRDRLQLIDYENLSINNNNTEKLPGTSSLSKRSRSITKKPIKANLINPDKMTYIHVKTLNEGQQFGITDLIFPNQPELTLIGNECECILLNKSSFINFASDQYKQTLSRTEIPYPNDSTFYKTYHANEVWKRFSKQIYIDAYERINQQHPKNTKRSISIKNQPPQQQPILVGVS